MLEKIRQRLLDFIYSEKDVPLLAGFSVGFYVLLFYYSKNFALANSLIQLGFFAVYYIIIPTVTLYVGYKLLPLFKLAAYKRNFLFVGIIGFFTFFFLEINHIPYRKKILLGVVIIACILAIKLKMYYKLFIVLLFFISVFNIPGIVSFMIASIEKKSDWEKQSDHIEQAVFKARPNIYYIQPDGYTNGVNLKNSIHNFDNSDFETFLKENDFTVYEKHHSNYFSTLLSNSSMFSMKHHYIADDVVKYKAREIIISDNAVLRTLKHNKYKTFFITERPYLIMNHPDMGYDYCNISYNDIIFVKDGWSYERDVFSDLKKQMSQLKESEGNFFFVEKFAPGHIVNHEKKFSGSQKERIEEEKNKYLERIKTVNTWLKEVLTYIKANDPGALIIIGADHGGFVGFASVSGAEIKTENKL